MVGLRSLGGIPRANSGWWILLVRSLQAQPCIALPIISAEGTLVILQELVGRAKGFGGADGGLQNMDKHGLGT